jgi:hypothetical protein
MNRKVVLEIRTFFQSRGRDLPANVKKNRGSATYFRHVFRPRGRSTFKRGVEFSGGQERLDFVLGLNRPSHEGTSTRTGYWNARDFSRLRSTLDLATERRYFSHVAEVP